MAKRALAGLIEAGSEVVATIRDTIGLRVEGESGFRGIEDESVFEDLN